MVLMELDKSAQAEAQVCKRQQRLGQKNNVCVYRLACLYVPQKKATLDQQTKGMGFISERMPSAVVQDSW